MTNNQSRIVIARESPVAPHLRGEGGRLKQSVHRDEQNSSVSNFYGVDKIASAPPGAGLRNDMLWLLLIGYLLLPLLVRAQTTTSTPTTTPPNIATSAPDINQTDTISPQDALAALLSENGTINSPTVLVTDSKTGEVLAERGSEIKRPIASLTKLMTAVIFLEHNPGWKKRVTFKKSDRAIGATVALRIGDTATTRDLFYAMFVRSANNATRALARSTGLSEAEFVKQMNFRARILGMENTHFIEPTGLEAGNVATAENFLKLARYALKNPAIVKAATTRKYTFKLLNRRRWLTVTNPNKLFKQNRFIVTATKTGYTEEAGRNLLVRAKNKTGREVLIVNMGANKTGAQWTDMNKLLEAALGNKTNVVYKQKTLNSEL